MAKLQKYIRLYFGLLQQNIKTKLEYRLDFFLGAFSTVTAQLAGFLALWVIMQQTPVIKGWTLPETILIYSLLILAKSLNHMFADHLWVLGWAYVRTGDFDRYLVRPINPLFHFLADRFCEDGLGNFVIGLALLGYASHALGLVWTPLLLAYVLMVVISGGLIFMGINLITASLSFWVTNSFPIMVGVFQTHEFAKYPLKIYHPALGMVLTWLLPYSLISYYPSSYLLSRDTTALVWMSPVVAMVVLAVGYWMWLQGLKRYSSTGT